MEPAGSGALRSKTGAARKTLNPKGFPPKPAAGYAILTHLSTMLPRMSEKDKAAGMKSAYELALERLEKQGIERPRGEEFSDALREKIADVRSQADARLAELEILHRDRLKGMFDAEARRAEEEEYVRERRRIEENRDHKIGKLRGES